MREDEYRECKYIDSDMRFYVFEDFIKRGKHIKMIYNVLNHKIFYKWYVYAHSISIKRKNAIWEYLNDYISYEELCKYK